MSISDDEFYELVTSSVPLPIPIQVSRLRREIEEYDLPLVNVIVEEERGRFPDERKLVITMICTEPKYDLSSRQELNYLFITSRSNTKILDMAYQILSSMYHELLDKIVRLSRR